MPAQGWKVLLRGKAIDIVWADARDSAADVKRSLVEHDGYDPAIKVQRYGAKRKESPVPAGRRCPTCSSRITPDNPAKGGQCAWCLGQGDYESNPRRRARPDGYDLASDARSYGDPDLSKYRVDVWEERDRLSIVLYDPDGKEVAEWWDDDARQMIEDGFFKRARGPRGGIDEDSVREYAHEMGLMMARPKGRRTAGRRSGR